MYKVVAFPSSFSLFSWHYIFISIILTGTYKDQAIVYENEQKMVFNNCIKQFRNLWLPAI